MNDTGLSVGEHCLEADDTENGGRPRKQETCQELFFFSGFRGATAAFIEGAPLLLQNSSLRLADLRHCIAAELGKTALLRARNVERDTSLQRVFLKFEAGNPTGTHKDRIALAHVIDALERGYSAITVATCGSYGAAIAHAAAIAQIRCIVYLPGGYRTRRRAEMLQLGAELVELPGDYESSLIFSRSRAADEGWYDANPGPANSVLQQEVYQEIAFEIYEQLGDAPSVVAIPAGNGTTLAGVYQGFVTLLRNRKTSGMPICIAGSSAGKNPIISAFQRGIPEYEDLRPGCVRETGVNEPLAGWHAVDGEAALQALYENCGYAGCASDRCLISHAKLLRDSEGLSVLPASTAGLAVLLDLHRKQPFPDGQYVAVITGKKT